MSGHCRFQGFRTLRSYQINNVFSPADENIERLQQIRYYINDLKPAEALYIKRNIYVVINSILQTEVGFLQFEDHLQRPTQEGVRTVCDICYTNIFSGCWFCQHCGKETCQECYLEYNEAKAQCDGINSYGNALHKWLRVCLLDPSQFIAILNSVEELFTSQAPRIVQPETKEECNYPTSKDYISPLGIGWLRGEVIVMKLSMENTRKNWSPEYFIPYYLQIDEFAQKVSYKNDTSVLQNIQLGTDQGLSIGKNKVSIAFTCWPFEEDFSIKFPQHWSDIYHLLVMNNFSEYILPKGKYNLVSYFPKSHIQPELSAKLEIFHDETASLTMNERTTPLQFAVTDTFNVMLTVRQSTSKQDNVDVSNIHNIDLEEIKDKTSAAIWHVFTHNMVPLLRDFVREQLRIVKSKDPIHERLLYLTNTQLEQFSRLYGVSIQTVHQKPGIAVVIPAGSIYQAFTFRDCVKFQIRFFSPEHMAKGLEISREACRVKSQVDLFRYEHILYYSWLSISNSLLSDERRDSLTKINSTKPILFQDKRVTQMAEPSEETRSLISKHRTTRQN
ncbi:hypothetical protein K7432_004377 [Basidiobolus ranarum]